MFKLAKKETFKYPVTVFVPKDGGGFEPGRVFQATFKLLPQSQMDDKVDKAQNDAEILREVLIDWADVQDEAGTALPFTEENREEMIDVPYIRTALVKAYFEGSSGNKAKK